MDVELIMERFRAVLGGSDLQQSLSGYRVDAMLARELAAGRPRRQPIRARRQRGVDAHGRLVSESRKREAWDLYRARRDAFLAAVEGMDPPPAVVVAHAEPVVGVEVDDDAPPWWW